MNQTQPLPQPQPTYQGAFSAGILSPALHYRSDLQKWGSGAAHIENFTVLVTGGVANRAGTEFLGFARQRTAQPRLIPFIYNNTQSYVLECGEGYIRIISNGAYLTTPNGAVFDIKSPYRQADLFRLVWAQSADVLTLTHPEHAPMELQRHGVLDWTLQPLAIGTRLAAPTLKGTAVEGEAQQVNSTTKPGLPKLDYEYAATSVSLSQHDESAIGAPETITNYSIGYYSQYGIYNVLNWPPVEGADCYRIYRKYQGTWSLIGSTFDTSFEDRNFAPDSSQTPPLHTNPLTANNPVTVSYFQQRKIFGGSDNAPQNIWMSRTGNFNNFDTHTPIQSDDAITMTVASQQVSQVRHIIPMADLLMFTGQGVWKVSGGSKGDAITPSSITTVPQTFVGCSFVMPLAVNYDVLYVEAKGSHVRDLQFNFYADIYEGNDLSVYAEHLFYGYTLTDWRFSQFPSNLLWAIRNDGGLLGMTYLKEQQIQAWHVHTTPNGKWRAVCVVPEANEWGAIEDIAYFVVERQLLGFTVFTIERMVSRQLGAANDDPAQGWFVDCGLRYQGAPVSRVSGLEHLEGEKVSANVDGIGYTGLKVEGGMVTLPKAGRTITVGLGYEARLETLPISMNLTSSAPAFADRKRVSKIFASLYNSIGLQASTDKGKTYRPLGPQNQPWGSTFGGEGMTFTIPAPAWTQDGRVAFSTNLPLPVTLTSVQLMVEEGH